jgi:hypothetical protein
MNMPQVIETLERKLVALSQLRTSHSNSGDLEALAKAEAEIAETEATLVKLRAAE